MPLYAGFDIGIKNLAFCIVDSNEWKDFQAGKSDDPGIKLWSNLDLVGDPEICCGTMASGKNKGQSCGKKASWLYKLENNSIEYYCGRHKSATCKSYTPPKVKGLNMRNLKKKAFMELDKLDIFNNVVKIAIETQPRINQQMKMFSASIEAYFIIRQLIDNSESKLRTICASPAKNKLKLYNGPKISVVHIKDPYDQRKYLAQKHVEYFLHQSPETLDKWYYVCKKRDDLADAFLHCLLAMGGPR